MKPAALTPVAIALATQALPMPTHLVVARGPEMRVFYDYGEDGHLAGGTLIVDPNDPQHHTDFGLARAAVTGDWVVTTIANGGGPENRIDLVFLGDGYTESDLGTYAGHVDRVLQGFLSEEPLGAYASYFNVHRVDIVSDESGVDEPNLSIFRDTALDMTFGCGGIAGLLCVDTGRPGPGCRPGLGRGELDPIRGRRLYLDESGDGPRRQPFHDRDRPARGRAYSRGPGRRVFLFRRLHLHGTRGRPAQYQHLRH